MTNRVYIYSDGSCLASGAGKSGYASIVKDGDLETIYGGGYELSTNNRMELLGVIAPLEEMENPRHITVTTDSMYVKDGITKYIFNWIKRGWKRFDGGDVKNKDLWIRLWEACEKHSIVWEWVKGHSGHPENERCDKLAKTNAENATGADDGYKPNTPNTNFKPYPGFKPWKKWRR